MSTQVAHHAAPRLATTRTFNLLRLLADGEFHSGTQLAQHLDISRASVHKALHAAEEMGVELHSVRGRGYRLAAPLQWLDAARIKDALGKLGSQFHIEVRDSALSSNTLLMQRVAPDGAPSGTVLALEWQSAGRGRLGRAWHSSLGSALTFSLLWRFERGLSALPGLSLAVGVGLLRALQQVGAHNVALKWPNDVLAGRGVKAQGKLAGILLEAHGDMLGPSAVVIGIGLNLSLPRALRRQVGQPLASLADVLEVMPQRNQMLAVILCELYQVLQGFSEQGFAAVRSEWESHHAWQDMPVRLLRPDGSTLRGVARGVAADGALQLETPQGMQQCNVGEMSLRKSA